jgi:hypothetical protein
MMADTLDFNGVECARSQLRLDPAPAASGRKDDAAKNRLDLLPFAALEEVGKVLTHGAGKYAPDNWRKGMAWRRLIAAALRHIFAFARGEDRDPETGLSHLAHATCCLTFLLTYQLERLGQDDRAKEGK